MPRRPRAFRGRGKPLHPTTWLARSAGALNANLGSGINVQIDLLGEDQLEKYTSPTIVRIRGELGLGILPDQGSLIVTNEATDVFMGILVVEGDATIVPLLSTQDGQELPWLWLAYRSLGTTNHTESTFTSAGALNTNYSREALDGKQASYHIPVDAKSMRRVPSGHKLVLVTTNIARVGTPEAVLRGMLRVLIKE